MRVLGKLGMQLTNDLELCMLWPCGKRGPKAETPGSGPVVGELLYLLNTQASSQMCVLALGEARINPPIPRFSAADDVPESERGSSSLRS